jgi:hypothetical protein
MKRLINKVHLVLFKDDANGKYGLTHKETYNNPSGNNFNAFWNGVCIFHDVFEHWHELRHKYFQGKYAMNVGGEMAAMGAMWYYVDTLGLQDNRSLTYRSHRNWCKAFIDGTIGEIREAILSGYLRYGYTLECNVPKQKSVNNYEIEWQLDEYVSQVMSLEYTARYHSDQWCDEERERSKQYKASVIPRKIRDLHRWGYRTAQRLIPKDYRNRDVLIHFIEFFDEFTKNNQSMDLFDMGYNGMIVKVYKDKGLISWTATLTNESGKSKLLKEPDEITE